MATYTDASAAQPDAEVVRDTALNYFEWMAWLDATIATWIAMDKSRMTESNPLLPILSSMIGYRVSMNSTIPFTTTILRDANLPVYEAALAVLDDGILPTAFTPEKAKEGVRFWSDAATAIDKMKKAFDAVGGFNALNTTSTQTATTQAVAAAVNAAITGTPQPATAPVSATAKATGSALLGAAALVGLWALMRGKKRG